MTTEPRLRLDEILVVDEAPRSTASEQAPKALSLKSSTDITRGVFGRQSVWRSTTKRAADVLLASILLVALSPIIAITCVVVTLHLRRAPFFLHERLGRNGVPFKCLKVRTMRESGTKEDSSPGAAFKSGTVSRTTTLTRLLRKTSLDELPQLLNVVSGEMSLVGPRPIVAEELRMHYGELAPLLLASKPGLTGLWIVAGRSTIEYPQRVLIELKYVATSSWRLDLRILVQTIAAVLSRRGAY
jgi:exopolysaccharide production protein ExoY